ncbi:MAG TPA: hypothetical protein VJ652_20145 [Noviherbaspirillum sp.]|nr:hypothetical protein [Noviherbaspirillum sp.]
MRAILRFVSAAALALLSQSSAHAFDLITDAEYRQEMAAQANGVREVRRRAAPMPGAPHIEVLAPNTQDSVTPPFDIRVKFVAENDAQIVAGSFKVLYGMFGIDITQRVMQAARFENNVLRIEKANIPAGKHRLTLKIMDSQQREAQQELSVLVQAK